MPRSHCPRNSFGSHSSRCRSASRHLPDSQYSHKQSLVSSHQCYVCQQNTLGNQVFLNGSPKICQFVTRSAKGISRKDRKDRKENVTQRRRGRKKKSNAKEGLCKKEGLPGLYRIYKQSQPKDLRECK